MESTARDGACFLGLAALFFRELALPYCVLCIVLAWRERKRSELAVWLLGLAAWLVFFRPALLDRQRLDRSGRSCPPTRLDSIRRRWFRYFDGSDEYLSLAGSAMANGDLLGRGLGWHCRLEYAIGHASRIGDLFILSGFCHRRPQFQSILGLHDCPPSLFRRRTISRISQRLVSCRGMAPYQKWKSRSFTVRQKSGFDVLLV